MVFNVAGLFVAGSKELQVFRTLPNRHVLFTLKYYYYLGLLTNILANHILVLSYVSIITGPYHAYWLNKKKNTVAGKDIKQ